MTDPTYVCRDCCMYLVNRDLHYIRSQDWRYPTLEDVKVRLDTIIDGNLTGNWYDCSDQGFEDKQTDDECPNCGRTDKAYRVPILPTDKPRNNERDADSVGSWYVVPAANISEAESSGNETAE